MNAAPITVTPVDQQSAEELAALRFLNSAVYPPEVFATWPGRAIEWSRRQYSVVVWNKDRTQALTHAGMVIRLGLNDGVNLKIGGIGGVQTHPDHRRQGHCAMALARCVQFFEEQGDVDVGLLVCSNELIPFYERLGWQRFAGDLYVTQKGQRQVFTFNQPMLFPIRKTQIIIGTIDLLGPPW